jgi:hypothetical protein
MLQDLEIHLKPIVVLGLLWLVALHSVGNLNSKGDPSPLVIQWESLVVEDGGDMDPGDVLARQIRDCDGVLARNQRKLWE